MKATLFAMFVALLMVGCGEQNQSVGSDLPSLPSFNPNESEFERRKRLAEGGDKIEQNNLGVMYDDGEGVPEDDKEAVKWYTKAAEQGVDAAQYNLGNMYRDGEGVPQDYKEAFKWYTKAAEQGMPAPRTTLGLCTTMEKVFRRTTRKRSSGTARRPSRGLLRVRPTWLVRTKQEKEYPKI